jgi:hypothetical protein
MEDLLKAKFLLIVQGNDLASQFYWTLASNSVPFMAEPTVESWLMESLVVPWKHYVPVQPDFSDLVDRVQWAISNPREAEIIAAAGRDYMMEFRDADREQRIRSTVLHAYSDRVVVHSAPYDPTNSDLVKCTNSLTG